MGDLKKINLEEAWEHCSHHREEIMKSKFCACFYCLKVFPRKEIEEWTDWEEDDTPKTAICPKCKVDAVLGNASGLPIRDTGFLEAMYERWFECGVTLTAEESRTLTQEEIHKRLEEARKDYPKYYTEISYRNNKGIDDESS